MPAPPTTLFRPVRLGALTLANRMVMAPMTRARAHDDGTPSALMAHYYAQRATAGLIIAEGTHPVASGAIGPNAPGLFTDAHQNGWARVADAVHEHGGRVFLQLMHAGRLAHPDFLPDGAEGALTNEYGPEDPENYAQLIREIRNKLPNARIAISAPASTGKLAAMNIPLLVDAGAQRIDLLAFDAFGTPWAEHLDHHAPLRHDPNAQGPVSADAAVKYLVGELNIDSSLIHLAYATHTRNAQGAKVSRISPLTGTYEPQGTTVGTFQSGTSTHPDILRNYLDLETGKGRNGFTLHTDTTADADFLYNADSGVFISLDTPRTVKAKAEYARANGLGGLYAYRADGDCGLLANAAREGLNHTAIDTPLDMKPLYTTGKS